MGHLGPNWAQKWVFGWYLEFDSFDSSDIAYFDWLQWCLTINRELSVFSKILGLILAHLGLNWVSADILKENYGQKCIFWYVICQKMTYPVMCFTCNQLSWKWWFERGGWWWFDVTVADYIAEILCNCIGMVERIVHISITAGPYLPLRTETVSATSPTIKLAKKETWINHNRGKMAIF